MTIGIDWKVLLGEVILAKSKLEERDIKHLEPYTLPKVPATDDAVSAFESSHQALPREYRSFLLHADGWPQFYMDADLFGLPELQGQGCAVVARARADKLLPPSLPAPSATLDPGDDWPELTVGPEAFTADSVRLNAWIAASPLRARTCDGARLLLGRRRPRTTPAAHTTLNIPADDRPSLWTLDVIHPGRSSTHLVLHPGVELLRVGVASDHAQLQLHLNAQLCTAFGLQDPQVQMTVAEPQRTSRHVADADEVDLRDNLARLLLAGGIHTPQLDQLARQFNIEEAERAAARTAISATYRHAAQQDKADRPAGAVRALTAVLQRHGLDHDVEQITTLARPALALRTTDPAGGIGRSRFGGCPDLPEGMAWPEIDGELMPFLLQLDLASLPPVSGLVLPQTGVLSFFCGDNESADEPGGLVCHLQGTLTAASPPHDRFCDQQGQVYPQRGVAITPVVQIPPHGTDAFDALGLPDGDVDAYLDAAAELFGKQDREEASFLGGYPDTTGGDLAAELTFATHRRSDQRASSPSELSRKAHQRPTWRARLDDWTAWQEDRQHLASDLQDWVTLLVLDSHDDAGFCWWDAGTLNFLIRSTDLHDHRFDRVRVVLTTS